MQIGTGSLSQILFATMMIVLGAVGFYLNDFAPVLQPIQDEIPARQSLIYLSSLIPLITGLLCCGGSAALSSRVLFAPTSQESWSGSGETLVVVAAAWMIYIWRICDLDHRHHRFLGDARAIRGARNLYGLALIPVGIAHLVYLTETVELVPGWLPFPLGWAVATGCAFVLAGFAIVIDRHAAVAAWLAAGKSEALAYWSGSRLSLPARRADSSAAKSSFPSP